jgi:hypothetical protein
MELPVSKLLPSGDFPPLRCECLNDSAFQTNVSLLWTTTSWVRHCLEGCHFPRARTACSLVNSDASLRTLSNVTKLAALKSQRWRKS